VTIAGAFSNTFAGIRPADVDGFLVAQALGAAAGALVFSRARPGDATSGLGGLMSRAGVDPASSSPTSTRSARTSSSPIAGAERGRAVARRVGSYDPEACENAPRWATVCSKFPEQLK
jgi:hypothetical protein